MKIARFIFALFGINTYIIYTEESENTQPECAIIDPGMSSQREREAIVRFITDHNLKVTHLINTHLHVDHAADNGFIIKTYKVPLEANALEQSLLESLPRQAEMFGLDFEPEACEITTFLSDGDVVKIGDEKLKVLHVPGHSPGSIALYSATNNFLISGDALFAHSIGRTDLPGGSTYQLLNAIKEKLFTLPDNTVVYPGHGDPTTIGEEKRNNPFF